MDAPQPRFGESQAIEMFSDARRMLGRTKSGMDLYEKVAEHYLRSYEGMWDYPEMQDMLEEATAAAERSADAGRSQRERCAAFLASYAISHAEADLTYFDDSFLERAVTGIEDIDVWPLQNYDFDAVPEQERLSVMTPLGELRAEVAGDKGVYDEIYVDLVQWMPGGGERLLQVATIGTSNEMNQRRLASQEEPVVHVLSYDGIEEMPRDELHTIVSERSFWYEYAPARSPLDEAIEEAIAPSAEPTLPSPELGRDER